MERYQKIKNNLTGLSNYILRIDTTPNIVIPDDPANVDYQEYLEWLAEGNEPEPADTPEAE
jgi:hypothetical protein